MLCRNRKKNDVNKGKWIGVGGKFEQGETAGECVKREVFEETGIRPSSFCFHGIINFRIDIDDDEEMYLYTADITDEEASSINYDCPEGTLKFIDDEDIWGLNLWEGDRIFMKDLLEGRKRISYDLTYESDRLIKYEAIPLKNILFDLDGTLIDTGEGIMKSAAYSLRSIGIEVPDHKSLGFFVGPPLIYTYMTRYGVDEALGRELIRLYRERYEPVGLFECDPYPGVRECLRSLKEEGYRLFIASSKPEKMCRKLMDYFEMSDYFDEIVGATPDGRIDTKTQVISELFRRKNNDNEYISRCVLIGDTGFDMRGAADSGISGIGVSYGYGDVSEMEALGALTIAHAISDIPSVISDINGSLLRESMS